MPVLAPFRALRPVPAAAPLVAAVPYDVVATAEARALAAGNPLSFLHVSRAEIDLPSVNDPYDGAVYAQAAENLRRLQVAAPLVVEDEPALYVYQLQMGTHVQTGIAGCYAIDDYDRDVIKKHERTRRDKEDDRTRHVLALRAQTGPVFLTYRATATIDAAVQAASAPPPLFDFTAADSIRHTLWTVPPAQHAPLVAGFAALPALYIADGHHRAASAARARQALREQHGGAAGEWDSFLAVAFPHDQMQILPYNRVIRDLNGRTPDNLLAELRTMYAVADGTPAPARPGDVSMFLAGRWYTITLGAATAAGADSLDVSRLQDTVLGPLLGIGDVRADRRIDFVGGARGSAELERLVGSGAAAVAFAMHPVSIDDLMAISDAGGIMPPKSTWFEPKLRDGLLIHVI